MTRPLTHGFKFTILLASLAAVVSWDSNVRAEDSASPATSSPALPEVGPAPSSNRFT